MLRNYTETVGGLIVSGTRFVGLTGAELLSVGLTGDFGPSIWHNKGLDPARRYRAVVASTTNATLLLREDGSGESLGSFTAELRLYEDNQQFADGVGLGTSESGLGLLRNYSEMAGGQAVSGTRFVGLLGAEILSATASGDFGPGVFANQGINSSRRYRALVITSEGASFVLNEDGSGQANGTFSATLLMLEDNLVYESAGELGVMQFATGLVDEVERLDDRFRFNGTIGLDFTGAIHVLEIGDDRFSARGALAAAIVGTLQAQDLGDDDFRVEGNAGRPYSGTINDLEPGDDSFVVRLVVATTSVVGGMLSALASEFEEERAKYGLFIDSEGVLLCAVKATRYYAGWATLEDVSARHGVFAVTGATTVTPDEWAIIKPLFILYVDRESALAVEASRVMGVELVGRDSATIASEIVQAEETLPQRAYVEPIQTFGLPAGF